MTLAVFMYDERRGKIIENKTRHEAIVLNLVAIEGTS